MVGPGPDAAGTVRRSDPPDREIADLGKPTLFTEPFHVRVTPKTAARIRQAALEDERDPTSWIREVIRKALEAAERRRQRAAD